MNACFVSYIVFDQSVFRIYPNASDAKQGLHHIVNQPQLAPKFECKIGNKINNTIHNYIIIIIIMNGVINFITNYTLDCNTGLDYKISVGVDLPH